MSGTWPGEPLYTIEGWVSLDLESGEALRGTMADGELRVGLFWTPKKGASVDFAASVEQEVETVATFPARYFVNLYAPPDPSLLTDGYAVGLVLAYLDQDGNGRWDVEFEPLVGGAPLSLVLYTTASHPGAFGLVSPGFSRFIAEPCPDGYSGPTQFQLDNSPTVDLVVNMEFPVDLLADLDCDGTKEEWTGVCPPPAALRERCGPEGRQVAEPSMCAICAGLLPPKDADLATCDAYFERCLGNGTSPPECETELYLCRGEAPDGNPYECQAFDLECTCKRVYDDCLTAGYDHDVCGPKYEACRGP